MDLKSLDVNDLIVLARQNDDFAFSEIATRYTPMLVKQVSELSSSVSAEELLTEAIVALHKAVLAYDVSLGKATFGTYARTCVRNHLLDFVSRASSTVIDSRGVDVENVAVFSGIQSHLEREETLSIIKSWARGALSDYEYDVFLLWLAGEKTAQIAERLGQSPKSVDNAKNRMFKHLRAVRDAIDTIFALN